MPIEVKKSFSSNEFIQKAAERRAADEAHTQYSESEIQKRAKSVRSLRASTPVAPPVAPGQVFNSVTWANYVRDAKMSMGVIASTSESLGEEIGFSSRRNFALLDDLQREVQALDAYVTEEEIKINGRYSQVHYNSWIRPKDSGLAYSDTDWLVDYKTGLPFQADHIADIIPGTGMTLPLKHEVKIPIVRATLVGEETDVGDTKSPIVSNDPKNLLRKDRVFRHVIIRRDHDKTSRKYNHTPSTMTLLLEFASTQLVNMLNVRPLGHSSVYVEDISYINESGEEVALTEYELPNEVELNVLFEPIRTRFLKVRFRQYAPVARQHFDAADIRVRELNKLLRGAGFSQLLTEKPEEIMGRVYDFSLESVRCSLRSYENLGVYRSQPMPISAPMGISYTDKVESIVIQDDSRSYGTKSFLAEGEVLLERYLGVDLHWSEGGRAFRDLIPVPDSRAVQREFMPIVSGECQAKLFPDLTWSITKNHVSSVTYATGSMTITFAEGHGYSRTVMAKNTDRLVLNAGPGDQAAGFNISSVCWYVVDEDTLIVVPSVLPLNPGTLGKTKIVPYVFLEEQQPDPISVYAEETLLAFGTDYLISLDRGATWISQWPRDARWHTLKSVAQAGKFKVKILNPDSSKLYWTQYKPLRNQQLSKRPGVNLKQGRVVFDKRFVDTSGTMSTVIVSRADSVNPYLTPVLLSYFLRVREYVS